MKRLLPFFLACVLLLTACAAGSADEIETPFVFYYCSADTRYGTQDGPMYAQTVSLDVTQTDLQEIVRLYLTTTPDETAAHPVPREWSLASARLENATAVVQLSGNQKLLSAAEHSLLCACLARTLLQLEDVLRVSVTVPGSTAATVLTSGDILLWDSALDPQEEIILYFPDAARRYLVRSRLTVPAMSPQSKAEYIVRQLLNAEALGQPDSCIPAGTTLLRLTLENGLCTVDLSSQFETDMDGTFAGARMAVYSIVNSLTELPEIRTVDLYVAGAPLQRLDLLELGSGLTRDEGMLAAAAGSESVDITLYPACTVNGQLTAIPCRIEPSEDMPLQVLNALLNYSERNGIRSYIPRGTKVLSLRIEDGTCTVDLTGEFLPEDRTVQEETLAVRSLIATMYALREVSAVEILVEGIEPAYLSHELTYLRQPLPQWFAE